MKKEEWIKYILKKESTFFTIEDLVDVLKYYNIQYEYKDNTYHCSNCDDYHGNIYISFTLNDKNYKSNNIGKDTQSMGLGSYIKKGYLYIDKKRYGTQNWLDSLEKELKTNARIKK